MKLRKYSFGCKLYFML